MNYYPLFQQVISDYLWIILPLIGAAIGWFTNYIAVKMLFRPRRVWNILGLKVQGVFPKRQAKLAQKISAVVSKELLSGEDLKHNLNATIEKLDLKKVIVEEIDNIILSKLPEEIPMIKMFLNNEVAGIIKNLIARELEGSVNNALNNISTEFSGSLDLGEVVREKITSFSPQKMEELVISVMQREFQFIEVFGGLIGFVIGLMQVLLVQISI